VPARTQAATAPGRVAGDAGRTENLGINGRIIILGILSPLPLSRPREDGRARPARPHSLHRSRERPMTTKTPRQFFRPLAIGAPEPFRELPLRLERMIH